jgi:hypothetical protein
MLCLLTVVIVKVMLRLLARLTVEAGLPFPARSGGAIAALPRSPAGFRHRAPIDLRRLRSWSAGRTRGRDDGSERVAAKARREAGTSVGADPGRGCEFQRK